MARRPHVLLSAAMSVDGYIDDATDRRLVLSGQADLDRVDELRAGSDAIMVGAGTVRLDNPRLAVRSAARRARRRGRGQPPSPVKVTLTASGELDPAANFFAGDGSVPLVYVAAVAAGRLRARLGDRAIVVPLPAIAGSGGAPGDLAWLLADLAHRGIGSLLVEGGALVFSQFLSGRLADEFLLAVAPVFVADPAAPRLLSGEPSGGRMRLAGLSQAGDMAVLRYLP